MWPQNVRSSRTFGVNAAGTVPSCRGVWVLVPQGIKGPGEVILCRKDYSVMGVPCDLPLGTSPRVTP